MTSEEWEKIEKKLAQLRALARQNASLDEARNAALAFCGILDRHELQVLPKDGVPIDAASDVSSYSVSANRVAAEDLMTRMAKARNKQRAEEAARRTPPRSPRPTEETESGDFPAKAAIAAERIRRGVAVFTSKYAGECLSCGQKYVRGERIYWKRNAGSWHPNCWIKTIFPNAKAPGKPPEPVASVDSEDDEDDFDGTNTIWGGSPMRSKR